MPRLIVPALFDGAQMTGAGLLARLTVWERDPAGDRIPRHYTGDEAEEAATEVRDLLAGQSEPEEAAAVVVKVRKRKEKV